MRKTVRTYEASDYAGLEANGFYFYYGYEFDKDDNGEVWGFKYSKQGKEVFRISYEEMSKYENCPDRFSCNDCLLFGIGIFLVSQEPKGK